MRQNALFGACSEWCLCVCGTAIAVPDWSLGGHPAMSVSVRTSAERERFRLGYLADAFITHRCDDVGPQLLPALADGGFALALELVPGPFDRGQFFELDRCFDCPLCWLDLIGISQVA